MTVLESLCKGGEKYDGFTYDRDFAGQFRSDKTVCRFLRASDRIKGKMMEV